MILFSEIFYQSIFIFFCTSSCYRDLLLITNSRKKKTQKIRNTLARLFSPKHSSPSLICLSSPIRSRPCAMRALPYFALALVRAHSYSRVHTHVCIETTYLIRARALPPRTGIESKPAAIDVSAHVWRWLFLFSFFSFLFKVTRESSIAEKRARSGEALSREPFHSQVATRHADVKRAGSSPRRFLPIVDYAIPQCDKLFFKRTRVPLERRYRFFYSDSVGFFLEQSFDFMRGTHARLVVASCSFFFFAFNSNTRKLSMATRR